VYTRQKLFSVSFVMLFVLIVFAFGISDVFAQQVVRIRGHVHEPAGLKLGDRVTPGQFITTAGVVVLEYYWPSDQLYLPCVSVVVINNATVKVPSLDNLEPTSNCRSASNPQAIIYDLRSGFRGTLSPVTFYASAKGEVGEVPKHVRDSISQYYRFMGELDQFIHSRP
jgi:hypothetical protein